MKDVLQELILVLPTCNVCKFALSLFNFLT